MTMSKREQRTVGGIYSIALLFCASGVVAEENPSILEGFTVKGNKELPEVVHVVPWQNKELALPAEDRGLAAWKRALIQPVEREALLREVPFSTALRDAAEADYRDSQATPGAQ